MTLALTGGIPAVRGPLKKFDTLGPHEQAAVMVAAMGTLSGYLGGIHHGGPSVSALEREWATAFGVKHAIAVNSATSGLLAAAAVTMRRGDKFYVSPYTMSATAAAPALLGCVPNFVDIERDCLGIDPAGISVALRAVVVTNLFGCPAKLQQLRYLCDRRDMYMIEDNAQSPMALERGISAGTIGHIGVFSLNVHKHIQCGEGGIIVTNEDMLAEKMREFMNHGELFPRGSLGLNLRMTETTAAIARIQLGKARVIIDDRVDQAKQLTRQARSFGWITPFEHKPIEREHVYYHWPFLYNEKMTKVPRDTFVTAMRAEGFPINAGYVTPLNELDAFRNGIHYATPVVKDIDSKLCYFENCGYTLTQEQIQGVGIAFLKFEDNLRSLQRTARIK